LAGYEVVTEALREEAKKWDELTPRVESIRRDIQSATLGPMAFFAGDIGTLAIGIIPADILLRSEAYEDFRAFVETALRGAETEFGQIADTLIKIAGMYEQAEKVVEFDRIDDVFTA
jgi:hypothetical protein